MQQRLELERSATEEAARQTLQHLQASLNKCADAALTTTENAIHNRSEALSQRLDEDLAAMENRYSLLSWALLKAWVWYCLLAAALLAGLLGGSWGFVSLSTRDVRELRQELAALEREKEALLQTMTAMQSKTWGLRLHSDQKGRFIILPPGVKASTDWTVGKQNAIKLE